MNPLNAPVAGESLAEAGERIRAAAPIRGERATDEDCRIRRELIEAALAARDIEPGDRNWHTAQLADGHVVGVWAQSVDEAELDLTVWWGVRCHWVVVDPVCGLFHEYFPKGKRSATEADRRFPLARPRGIRDRFAPADSLLDAIWMPQPADSSLAR
ncbi:hypothetical protein ACFC1W_07760 [Microbacterium sp. NPDC056003]|uniref:hypothetical protein n=1 Tax=Microbacterium sp. NPDC056003 TaxID=3345676 RepID=UPI0035DE7112